jgi:hypothetical protein
MTVGADLMPPKKKKPPEPAPDERVAVIQLKGSAEYAQWLEDVHRKTRIPKAAIFRLAIEEWAAKNGHPLPPER